CSSTCPSRPVTSSQLSPSKASSRVAGAAAWAWRTAGASEATYGVPSCADGATTRGAGAGLPTGAPSTTAGGTTSSDAVAGGCSVKWERVASHTGTAMVAVITT